MPYIRVCGETSAPPTHRPACILILRPSKNIYFVDYKCMLHYVLLRFLLPQISLNNLQNMELQKRLTRVYSLKRVMKEKAYWRTLKRHFENNMISICDFYHNEKS